MVNENDRDLFEIDLGQSRENVKRDLENLIELYVEDNSLTLTDLISRLVGSVLVGPRALGGIEELLVIGIANRFDGKCINPQHPHV